MEPGQGEYVVSWRWSAARGVAGVAGDEAAEKGDLEVASRDGRRTDCGSGGWPNKERKNERIFSRNFKFVSRLWPKIKYAWRGFHLAGRSSEISIWRRLLHVCDCMILYQTLPDVRTA